MERARLRACAESEASRFVLRHASVPRDFGAQSAFNRVGSTYYVHCSPHSCSEPTRSVQSAQSILCNQHTLHINNRPHGLHKNTSRGEGGEHKGNTVMMKGDELVKDRYDRIGSNTRAIGNCIDRTFPSPNIAGAELLQEIVLCLWWYEGIAGRKEGTL